MANRRFGNQGLPQRANSGGRNFGGPASNISPWQGGAPPGAPANSQNIQNQLALALSNLIQQSAQPPSSDGPPSLLNLNTSPGFFNQDQYNNHTPPRFPGGNRGRQDFRRNEPYNKNRMSGWRTDNNRNRGSNNFSPKKDFNSRDNHKGQRPAPRDNSKKLNDKPPSKQDKPAAEADNGNKNVKQPQQQVQQQQVTPVFKTDDTIRTEEKKEDGPKAPTKYDNIPNGLLHCCVCNKSMWDGESFQNHVGGKAHKQMIASLEESFQITVNILRENMRLTEERKVIEFERMKRSRRLHHNNQHEPESHCNMCDLKFMGKIVLHRQSEGHQRLKRFLHPKCSKCHLEFTSRMEWVDHIFLPEHLHKVKEYLDNKNTDYGEYKLTMKVDIDNDPLLEENMQNEDDNPILELSDDLNNLFNRIPVFKHDRPVAKDSLKPATGFVCEMCKMFMATKEASEEHNKSYKHYVKFVETIKAKYQRQANEKKKADEAAAKQATETTSTDADLKPESDADDQQENGNLNANGHEDEEVDNLLDDIITDVKGDIKDDSQNVSGILDDGDVTMQSDVEVEQKPATRQTRRSAARNGTSPAAKKARS